MMTGSDENTNTAGRIAGALCGVLLSILWVCLVFFIESWNNTQHTQMNFHNPLIAWIYFGPLPLFIAAGYFYLDRSSGPDLRQPRQFATMKGLIAGFFLWIVVILSVPGTESSGFFYPTAGGFLLMLVLITLFQGKNPANGF
jgi:hypothetical protein